MKLPEWMHTQEKWLYAWALGAVAFGTASLLVPLYVIALGGDAAALGVLAATAGIAAAVGGIGAGRLASSSTRQRQLFLLVLNGSAAVLVLLPFADNVTSVLLMNAAMWSLFAAAGPVLTVLVVTGAEEAVWNRRIAQLQTFQGYGWAMGLVLGLVWLQGVGSYMTPQIAQRTLFWTAALLAGVAGVLGGQWLPKPTDRAISERRVRRVMQFIGESSQQMKGATFVFFSPTRMYWATRALDPRKLREKFTPQLTIYFAAVIAVFTGIGIFFAPLPIFLRDTGYGPDTVFGLYLLSSLGAALFYNRAGGMLEEVDIRWVHAAGLGARSILFPLIGGIGAILATSRPGLIAMSIGFVLVGLSWAVIAVSATTLVTRLAPSAVRSDALGLYAGINALAGAVGSMIGGILATQGYIMTFALAGGLLLAGAVVVLQLPIPDQKE